MFFLYLCVYTFEQSIWCFHIWIYLILFSVHCVRLFDIWEVYCVCVCLCILYCEYCVGDCLMFSAHIVWLFVMCVCDHVYVCVCVCSFCVHRELFCRKKKLAYKRNLLSLFHVKRKNIMSFSNNIILYDMQLLMLKVIFSYNSNTYFTLANFPSQ